MSELGKSMPKEYSDKFDELRQNRVQVSFYKYGTAADNFGMKLVNAIESHDMCIKKYQQTVIVSFDISEEDGAVCVVGKQEKRKNLNRI